MSTSLATAICIGSIVWLFYRERKRDSRISRGLWVPIIWFGIIASKPVGLWFAGQAQADVNYSLDGSPLDRSIFLVLIVLGLAVLRHRQVNWGEVLRSNQAVSLLFLYFAISVIWSDYSFIAFKRWIKDVGSLVMILVVLTDQNPSLAMRRVMLQCAYLLIPLSVLLCKYYVTTGTGYNVWTGQEYYRGITAGKNQLGRLAVISGLFLLWDTADAAARKGWFRGIWTRLPECAVLLGCCWLLRKANSATSTACFVAATGAFIVLRTKLIRNNPGLLAVGAFASVVIALLFFFIPDLRGLLTERLGRSSDLTERTTVWQRCLEFDTNPLLGTGYASFWLITGGIQLGSENIGEAHNGYLETYLNNGFIGVGLLLLALISAWRNVFRHLTEGSDRAPIFAALILLAFLYNLTESAFYDTNIVGFCFWLAAARYTPKAAEALEQHEPVEHHQPGSDSEIKDGLTSAAGLSERAAPANPSL